MPNYLQGVPIKDLSSAIQFLCIKIIKIKNYILLGPLNKKRNNICEKMCVKFKHTCRQPMA